MYKHRQKPKERKRNKFFPEVIDGTADIILQTSHSLIITSNIKQQNSVA
jgi:hypothetical protein